MKKITAKRLLALVLALAMVISMFPGMTFTAEATETENATVKIGAEVLLESEYWQNYLAGKNVALFTNQVCVDADMNHLADKLAASDSINLVCLFGGEHGLRGAAQAGAAVPHCIDATTGLINWSLYSGGTIDTEALGIAALAEGMENPSSPNRPTRAMITGNNGAWYEPIDVILFDLQEIGSKTWTYLYNLADLMAACIESKKYYGQEVELIVLDRPSPISSDVVEGTMHASNNQTGFARFPLPSRYGLTMGEVALMYQGEGWKYFWQKTYPGGPENLYGATTSMSSKTYKGLWPWETEVQEGDTDDIIAIREKLATNFADKLSFADCPVTVIPCEGYTRDMYWDETGLEFILPSPNMPTAEACLLYTGTVWFEGLPINEGRGTTQPFTTISAPYIDAEELAARLNGFGLDGVIFRPAHTTTLSTNQLLANTNYVGQLAHGVQIHVTDKRAFSPIEMQTYLNLTLQALYGWETKAEQKDGEHFYSHYQLDYRSGSDWVSVDTAAFPKGATDEQIIAEANRMLALMDEQTADYKVMREKYLLDEYDVPADKELVNTLQPQVTLGAESYLKNAAGKKVAIITNQSGVTTDLQHIADVYAASNKVELVSLISTGYGLRGEFQTAEDGVYTDAKTGLTVYRVHEASIPAEALAGVEEVLFDIQDTGSRANGTVEMLAKGIEAAKAAGAAFTVLDRPNPIGSTAVEGPVDSVYGISTRHGMTNGELAVYLGKKLDYAVNVAKMYGYTRDMMWDDTGLQFIQTDRKIGTAEALLTYASLGWLEGTDAISYGWGTTKTYEFFGSPAMKDDMVDFADALNELELPGVRFRLAAMTPWNNTTELASILYPATACYGVQMHIMDEDAYNAVDTILNILYVMKEFFPEELNLTAKFDEITGSDLISSGLNNDRSLPELVDSYKDALADFQTERESCLIYGDVAEEEPSRVGQMLAEMSLRDKVTQMMMVDFRKWGETAAAATDFTEMNDEVRKIVEDYNFGSIIYFANNIKETEQSYNLTIEMQRAATKDGGIALIICADQEGGSVYRLGSGTALPGNMALGATYAANGTKYAYEAGKIIGSELSILGINGNLAPVVDVNNNANNPVIGLRSYSDDATMVGELASAAIAGMAEYNVIGTAKHFPGHGDTATDSHYGLPVVDKSLDVLKEVELKPYEVAIDQGIEMIMTAHILYPQLESDKIVSNKTGEAESLPATMSDDILTGLLKEEMGFEGIIVTDAMNMAGISSKWDQVQSVVIAVNAGVDMFCMPCQLYCQADLANLDAIIEGVIAAVESGEIPMERIDDAVTRILTVKENRGILDYNEANYSLEKANAVVGSDENREMEREIAANAVTVVKNENNALPLKLTENSKVLMLCPYNNERAQMLMAWNRAKDACLIPEGAQVDYYRFSSATINDDLKAKLDWADTYIIITEVSSVARMEYKHWLSAAPNAFCEYAAANGKTSVIASCDKPYDVQMYPAANAILAAYGCKGSSVDPTEAIIGGATGSAAAYGPNIIAAVEVALGTFAAKGALPVNVPKYDVESNSYLDEIVYERGFGLTYAAAEGVHHQYEWTVTTEATCTTAGTETGVCPNCGATATREIPAKGHSLGEWTVTTEAGCETAGVETRSCACGETETREIPALGHDYVNNVCTRCGHSDAVITVIASGWSGYTTWELTSDGTLTFFPTNQTHNGQTNMKNYWKVNGVLNTPWGAYAEQITKVVVSDGIHDLGQMAFYELPNLTTVVLGKDVIEVRNYTFKNCTALTTINLENVTSICEGAFYGCSALTDVKLNAGATIGDWAFSKTGVKLN